MDRFNEIIAFVRSYVASHGGGGGGVEKNYNLLDNLPQVNSITLKGNKSASDLGLAEAPTIDGTMLIF